MGLDANIYRVAKEAVLNAQADFSVDRDKYVIHEIAYFRKNSALQGFMHMLYRSKAGTDPEFNCCNVLVTKQDFENLLTLIKSNKLEPTTGFFYGSMDEGKYRYLREVVEEILHDIDAITSQGYVYYYDAWY